MRKRTTRIDLLLILLALGVASGAVAASANSGRREAAMEKLRTKFDAADTNHDGFLSRDEAAKGMPHVATRFDEADSDHDNRLSIAEVASWLAKARAAYK